MTPQVTSVPPPTVKVGDCGVPERDGVVSAAPSLVRADRDLDGDGRDEPVLADGAMCSADGNCYWNVFGQSRDGCGSTSSSPGGWRYLGTVAGIGIERLPYRGELGFRDLRSWWRLAGTGRFLVQTHRFRQGGYRLTEVLVCRRQRDGRLACAEDGK